MSQVGTETGAEQVVWSHVLVTAFTVKTTVGPEHLLADESHLIEVIEALALKLASVAHHVNPEAFELVDSEVIR